MTCNGEETCLGSRFAQKNSWREWRQRNSLVTSLKKASKLFVFVFLSGTVGSAVKIENHNSKSQKNLKNLKPRISAGLIRNSKAFKLQRSSNSDRDHLSAGRRCRGSNDIMVMIMIVIMIVITMMMTTTMMMMMMLMMMTMMTSRVEVINSGLVAVPNCCQSLSVNDHY